MLIFICVFDLGKQGEGAADHRGHGKCCVTGCNMWTVRAGCHPEGQLSPSQDIHHSTNTGLLASSQSKAWFMVLVNFSLNSLYHSSRFRLLSTGIQKRTEEYSSSKSTWLACTRPQFTTKHYSKRNKMCLYSIKKPVALLLKRWVFGSVLNWCNTANKETAWWKLPTQETQLCGMNLVCRVCG